MRPLFLLCYYSSNYHSVFILVPAEDADKRKRIDPKDNPFTQWFTNFSEADELLKLAAARQQVTINFYVST